MASDYSLLINFERGVTRDNSPQGHTLTPVSGYALDTTIFKFDSASGKFSTFTDALTAPEALSLQFGGGDFTIDLWMRNSDSTIMAGNFLDYGADDNNRILLASTAANLIFKVRVSSVDEISLAGAVTWVDDTWHHVAAVRSDNNWSVYFDGTRVDTQSKSYTVPDFGTETLEIIPNSDVSNVVWLDHFRILKGRAAWTGASFTVPTRPHLEFVEEGLTQKLLNESGVFDEVGNSIFPEIAPHGTAAPYIVMSKVSGTHEHVLGGTAGLVFNRIQLDMWSDTIRGSRIIADEVRKAIDGYSGVMGNPFAQHCIMEDEGTEVEFGEKNRDQRAFGVRQDYIIAHSE